MGLYRVKNGFDSEFIRATEVFPDVQLGVLGKEPAQWCIVVGCTVVVVFDKTLPSELEHFYESTWNVEAPRKILPEEETPATIDRYEAWLASLSESTEVKPYPVDRRTFADIIASVTFPPPPPNRPTLTPVYPPPAAPPPTVYGHLPFKTKTRAREYFYRFEAWPRSRKLTQGSPGTIGAGTYASPSSELIFLPTGFAAVARNALPSFFPAVFRYEIQPVSNKDIRCGAVIPNYGQSGGGVEVFFPSAINNRGPIANPVIVPPL
jgi:hypothetical protein